MFLAGAAAAPSLVGISIYGCDQGEAELFREMAPRFGIAPTITDGPVSDANIGLVSGNRCISVGHKSSVSDSLLRLLHAAGVRYISTRSVGYDHIDMGCAERLGISVETVAYSPDSVADFTLMLMLMALRNAKSVDQPSRILRLPAGRRSREGVARPDGWGDRYRAHRRSRGGQAAWLREPGTRL